MDSKLSDKLALIIKLKACLQAFFGLYNSRIIVFLIPAERYHFLINALNGFQGNAGHSIINDHAAGVEHSADHIDGVLGRTEFIRDLDTAPTGFDHFNVVVGVDVVSQ